MSGHEEGGGERGGRERVDGRRRGRMRRGREGGKGGHGANIRQARGDQLRNSIKVGHVSKRGAIPRGVQLFGKSS